MRVPELTDLAVKQGWRYERISEVEARLYKRTYSCYRCGGPIVHEYLTKTKRPSELGKGSFARKLCLNCARTMNLLKPTEE